MKKLTVRERVELLKSFCEKNNRLPHHSKSGSLEARLLSFMNEYKFNKHVEEIRLKYRKRRTFDQNLAELTEYCTSHKELPKKYGSTEEARLNSFMTKHRSDLTISSLIDKYRYKKTIYPSRTYEEWLGELREFVNKYNRLPNSSHGNVEARLAGFKNRNNNKPEVIEIIEKYRTNRKPSSYSDNVIDLREFLNKYNRLPNFHNEKNERRLSSFVRRYRDKDEIIDLVNKYKRYRTAEDNFKELIGWTKSYERMPRYNNKDKNEFRLKAFVVRHKNDERIIKLINKYGS